MFTFENINNKTYLAYEVNDSEQIDSFSLGMICNNEFKSFAPAFYSKIDDKSILKYDVTSKISAEQVFSRKLTKKVLLGFLGGLADAIIEAEDYMIDSNNIVFDMKYIYVNISNGNPFFIYLPVKESESKDISGFLKNLLFSVEMAQNEDPGCIGALLSYVNSSGQFSAAEFKKRINKVSGKKSVEKSPKNVQPKQDPVSPAQPDRPVPQPNTPYNSQQGYQPESNSYTAEQNIPVQSNIKSVTPQKITGSENVKPQDVYKKENDNMARRKDNKPNAQFSIPNAPNSGFSIPGADNSNNTPAEPQAAESDENISMFYLLSHYNKENAELYKAQKSAKKSKKKNHKKSSDPIQMQVPDNSSSGNDMPGYQSYNQSGNQQNNNMPQYNTPQNNYNAPQNNYGAQQNNYNTPQNNYGAQQNNYNAPQNNYGAQQNNYNTPQNNYGAQQNNYNTPQNNYGAQQNSYNTPQNNYGMPQQNEMQNSGYNNLDTSLEIDESAMDFGRTVILDDMESEETVILEENAVSTSTLRPFLVRKKNNERVGINKPVFVIGKDKNFTDYCVTDNSYISRSHANIIRRDDKFFLVDNNSRNYTYLNGEKLVGSTEVEIHSGDTVKFANEEFEFKLF
jgi:hypothetical protein